MTRDPLPSLSGTSRIIVKITTADGRLYVYALPARQTKPQGFAKFERAASTEGT